MTERFFQLTNQGEYLDRRETWKGVFFNPKDPKDPPMEGFEPV